ncbi:hypothetical protein P152DRAFT_171988 [Eremomyces bilateralis CBS 781.70]|uniref:Uncharacterized protein n=1 Tax=Eremomyces bilateralis CBS 781.70 TaxID=1392243 RepID=A0A6G1FTV0_9PEZI|nr:uncharacterized protein P152DRAFT_171988 [Eremomyces bilateralis CBS 781.70]KAF1809183.1 hypothetical protein P152DRAFT_171988 [Eremomyces bilateralis CBS 781.70]
MACSCTRLPANECITNSPSTNLNGKRGLERKMMVKSRVLHTSSKMSLEEVSNRAVKDMDDNDRHIQISPGSRTKLASKSEPGFVKHTLYKVSPPEKSPVPHPWLSQSRSPLRPHRESSPGAQCSASSRDAKWSDFPPWMARRFCRAPLLSSVQNRQDVLSARVRGRNNILVPS